MTTSAHRPGHGWSVYPEGALRMAGFRFSVWESLLADALTHSLPSLDEAWRGAEEHRRELLTRVFPAAVDATRDRAELRALSKLRTRVGRKRRVDADSAPERVREAVQAWNAELSTVDDAASEVERSYAEALPQLDRTLHQLSRDRRLREAVCLLSPSFGRALTRYTEQPTGRPTGGRERGVQQRFLLYLQRLVAKNETNSFFGPVGSVLLDPACAEPLRIEGTEDCGPPAVFSSPRLARGLAERMADDPCLRPHLALRRSPMFVLNGEQLTHLPSGRSRRLSPAEQALWWDVRNRPHPGAGDREKTEPEVGNAEGPEDGTRGRLFRLGALLQRVPLDEWRPEPLDSLEEWLVQLRDEAAAGPWLKLVRDLRAEVRSFAGIPAAERPEALGRVEGRVATTTGSTRQGAGRMYSDRSVLFEERENGLSLTVGAAAPDLATGLAPVLTYWAAAACQRFHHHQRLATELYDRMWPGAEVPLPTFLAAAADLPPVTGPTPAEMYVADLVEESGRQPGVDGPREVRLPEERLLTLRDAIDTPVLTSVDVMMAADGEAGAAGGSWNWVLGEAHAGHLLSVFPTDHFARERYPHAHVRRDAWLYDALGSTGRRPAWLVTGRETKIFQYRQPAVAVQLRSHLPEQEALPASHLTVRREGDGLVLQDATGPLWLLPAVRPAATSFDPLAPFSFPAVTNLPFSSGTPRPRVVVGDTVAQRASWRLPLPGLEQLRGAQQLLAARRLRHEQGMPDVVFARLPWEAKPTLLDFRNPISVSGFASLLRGAPRGDDGGSVEFSEMLPGPHELWLAGGRTFELRMLAVWAGA